MKISSFSAMVLCLLLPAIFFFSSLQAQSGIVTEVLSYTNKFRGSQGLQKLALQNDLCQIAQRHSENMAKGNVEFGHSGFDDRFRQASKKIKGFRSFAENVAYGVSSGKDVVNLWKNSTGHRRNMLGNFRFIGIGIARNRSGVIYYTEVFAN